jgi:hypothetical protein
MLRRLVALVVLSVGAALAVAQPPPPELERTERLIEELTGLKERVAAIQAELDRLLLDLREHKGALQNPPAYNAITQSSGAAAPASAPAAAKRAAQCAANTSKGDRCTRPAERGSRYCWQHQHIQKK